MQAPNLQLAHKRLEDRTYAESITLAHGDSTRLLGSLPSPFDDPAAIVLDPMYPPRRKSSALPGKSMQLMRVLLGGSSSDTAVDALLGAAFATRARRIVLKRPPEATTPESFREPTFSITSKLVRWDVWERG